MKALKSSGTRYSLGMFLLLAARLSLQGWLYRAGFQSLTADEFGRTVMAAHWALKPYALWQGFWMPFFMYLEGAALRIHWDLLWVPRGIAIFSGLASILIMYYFVSNLFDDRWTGALAALLLAVNPVHTWLSSTPLTEIIHSTLMLLSLLFLALYFKSTRLALLAMAAVTLAVANGFRFEAWIVSVVFSLVVLWIGANLYRKFAYFSGHPALSHRDVLTRLFILAAIALIPWVYPVAWLTGNALLSGSPLSGFQWVQDYNLAHYEQGTDWFPYLRIAFHSDPFLFVLAIPALILLWKECGKSAISRVYLAFSLLPLAVFLLLIGGKPEPEANITRYLAPFLFLLYPAAAFLLVWISRKFRLPRPAAAAVIIIALLLITFTQAPAALHFINDPSVQGLEVGQKIRELWDQQPAASRKAVMVELTYWRYFAIQVGANNVENIKFDRRLDYGNMQAPSFLMQDPTAFRKCLKRDQIEYFVVKSPELRLAVERELHITPLETFGEYVIYPVSDLPTGDAPDAVDCPLP